MSLHWRRERTGISLKSPEHCLLEKGLSSGEPEPHNAVLPTFECIPEKIYLERGSTSSALDNATNDESTLEPQQFGRPLQVYSRRTSRNPVLITSQDQVDSNDGNFFFLFLPLILLLLLTQFQVLHYSFLLPFVKESVLTPLVYITSLKTSFLIIVFLYLVGLLLLQFHQSQYLRVLQKPLVTLYGKGQWKKK